MRHKSKKLSNFLKDAPVGGECVPPASSGTVPGVHLSSESTTAPWNPNEEVKIAN